MVLWSKVPVCLLPFYFPLLHSQTSASPKSVATVPHFLCQHTALWLLLPSFFSLPPNPKDTPSPYPPWHLSSVCYNWAHPLPKTSLSQHLLHCPSASLLGHPKCLRFLPTSSFFFFFLTFDIPWDSILGIPFHFSLQSNLIDPCGWIFYPPSMVFLISSFCEISIWTLLLSLSFHLQSCISYTWTLSLHFILPP